MVEELRVKVLIFSSPNITNQDLRPITAYVSQPTDVNARMGRCLQVFSWVLQLQDPKRRHDFDLLLMDHFDPTGFFGSDTYNALFIDVLLARYRTNHDFVWADPTNYFLRVLRVVRSCFVGRSTSSSSGVSDSQPGGDAGGGRPVVANSVAAQRLALFMYYTAIQRPCPMNELAAHEAFMACLLYTSPSPRDRG